MLPLTLKGPGFFVYFKSGGGGGADFPPPPPSDLGRGATKNSEIWHVRRVYTNVLTKLQYWKLKHFWIMQIYVNYMHVFLFFIITDKMRPFGAFKLF